MEAFAGLTPAFWTFAGVVAAALITGMVTMASSRRQARTTEQQALQSSLTANIKMFNDNMMARLELEQKERAAITQMLKDAQQEIKELGRRVNRATAHIIALERRIIALGEAPPPRPDGGD